MRRERRRAIRIPGPFEGRWSGHAIGTIRVTDMSVGGCFVESRLGPAVGERLELEVHIDGIAPTRLSGVVAYACPPIGFGVMFTIDAAGVAALEETLFRRQACSTA